jgi:hypothetical protein
MTTRARRFRSITVIGVLVIAMVAALSVTGLTPSAAQDCGTLPISVDCGASADPPGGYFHGLIGVTGQGWVLDLGSRSGTSPGCGDCVWTIALDCPQTNPERPDDTAGCAGMSGAQCPPGTLPFRLYLTTSAVSNEVVGDVCLGGDSRIVLVGEDAAADVERYVDDITPPDLVIHRRPHGATLTGLATFFRSDVPGGRLGPFSFGGPTVTEAITLVPEQTEWAFGDGTSSGWLGVDAVAMHRYLDAGVLDGTLTTRWGATYTATFEGRTVGPFQAKGTVDHAQPFVVPVATSRPVLVGPPSG